MRFWKRAAGAIKDRKSILAVKLLGGHGPSGNADLESVMIKATSHEEHRVDCKNVKRTFQWLRTSPLYLKPLIYGLSHRMEKTKSWVVALKGLMLIHGVFCCDIPAVQKMGRLPFDLSNFSDCHLHPRKAWAFNAFIRAYFSYLDQRSAFFSSEFKKNNNNNNNNNNKVVVEEESLIEELEKLQELQSLIDMLTHIKPRNDNMKNGLILEAMDCIIVEVFDVYSKFCKRIARVLMRIYEVQGKAEARIGLKILDKATFQGEELSLYFEYCRDLGVLNAAQCPRIERIPREDIKDLERIISGDHGCNQDEKAIVITDSSATAAVSDQNVLTTVITHKWELFDDDMMVVAADAAAADSWPIVPTNTNPFVDSYNYSLVPYHYHHLLPQAHNQVQLPDLISF